MCGISTNFHKRRQARAKLLNKAMEEAEKMGANAIVGMKLDTNTDTGVDVGKSAGTVSFNSRV